MANHFYSHLHKTEESRQTTLKFLELEDECDRHNIAMLESMDIKGISKTNINKARKSFDLKTRDRVSLRKKTRENKLHPLGKDRTWITN